MLGVHGDQSSIKPGGFGEFHCGFLQKRAMRAHTLPTSHSQQLQAAHKDHTPRQRHGNVIPNFSLLPEQNQPGKIPNRRQFLMMEGRGNPPTASLAPLKSGAAQAFLTQRKFIPANKKKKEFRLKSFHLSGPRNVVEMVVLSVKYSIKKYDTSSQKQ